MKHENINLVVRQAEHNDIEQIIELSQRAYGKDLAMQEEMLTGQLAAFPEGQFVVEYNGAIVGHCATFIISSALALAPHTWHEITGQGFASRHDPDGDYLYGMEVCVDEHYRGLRIGQRLYNARKKLCRDLGLLGIVFGGRMPSLSKKIAKLGDVDTFIEYIKNGKIKDAVINFQLRNGFEIIGLLNKYLPYDRESLGYATHMLWRNPDIEQGQTKLPRQRGRTQDSVRIASVQYQVRKVDSFEKFAEQIEYFVDVAADYRSDFVLFPELLTIPLLSMETKRLSPQESI
ncbi:MAG: GNAT family N-acetyltransferase, partial [Rickettsiales bacterium]|nr:GNAT family N-acetyltransferase [Rickettsiales bacterium]